MKERKRAWGFKEDDGGRQAKASESGGIDQSGRQRPAVLVVQRFLSLIDHGTDGEIVLARALCLIYIE
ncbi:hypothetical protein [Desulfobulbus propionicus]|jgi:hypothetical protein|uniref:hypothetical protein n=1 Tax=Desulfobulbus propionicus TaxID=894 RepID=UPI0003086A64|nr:hypothetical protein [Desulfobulbus propionicus]